jgi:AraC-like DNA-binding protein
MATRKAKIYQTTPSGIPVSLRDWHVSVSQWGRWRHPAGYKHPAIVNTTDLLLWVESGQATCFLGAECFELEPGVLAYLPAERAFFYRVAPGVPFRQCTLHFEMRTVAGIRLAQLGGVPRLARIRDTEVVERHWKQIEDGIGGRDLGSHFKVCSAVLSLLGKMVEAGGEKRATVFKPHGKAYEAMALIGAKYAEPLSIKEIANALRITPEHLANVFRRTFRISPKLQILTLRMTRAYSLLLTTEKSAKEIAYAVGYQSPSVFERAFRTYFKASAHAIRRRALPTASGPQFSYRAKR